MKKVSTKRASQLREYKIVREEYFQEIVEFDFIDESIFSPLIDRASQHDHP